MKRIALLFILLSVFLISCQTVKSTIGNKDHIYKDLITLFKEKHPNEYIVYSALIDINDDKSIEAVIVTGDIEPKLWFINSFGKEQLVIEGSDKYMETFILDRGNQKQIAILTYFEPSNTQLYVFSCKKNKLEKVFEFMADWEISIIHNGFDMTWKKYKQEGGYDLVVDRYIWNEKHGNYIKQEL